MEKTLSVETMTALFSALSAPNSFYRRRVSLTMVRDIVDMGWAYPWQLEDLILSTDHRFGRDMIEEFIAYFELPIQAIYKKPRFANAGVVGHDGISLADTACLLIRLEEIGFDTDPMPFVAALLPGIQSVPYLTDSEISVLFYAKNQYRSLVSLYAAERIMGGEWTERKVRDASGRRLQFSWVDGQPYELEVKGSKYRRRTRQIRVACDYCKYEYTKGDPESALYHRTAHAEARRLFDPSPNKAFAKRLIQTPYPERVTATSPFWMHREVYERACWFRREFHYDFVQWNGTFERKNTSPESHGYLFSDHTSTHSPGTIIGACAFWNDRTGWRLSWVWLCPKMRRSGSLAHRWFQFLDTYGDFKIGAPLSDAMFSFVKKHGTEAQKSDSGISA
jgi:hypothetical protein